MPFRNYSFTLPHLTSLSIVIFVLVYSNLLNIANYSFLTFNYSGVNISNPMFSALRYSRLPILIIGVLIAMHYSIKSRRFETFISLNFDVIIFGIVLYFGLFNAIDALNGALYTIWQTFALIAILLFLFYLGKKENKENSYRLFFQFLFWSNFIILPLLLINISTLGEDWTYHMAYSDKTFYPYCALSMMLSIYMSRLTTGRSIFNYSKRTNAILEGIIILLLLFFVFLSARRTPLGVMFIISFIYMFYAIGKRFWKKLFLGLILTALTMYSVPKLLSYMEAHKYELSVLKKLDNLMQTGGTLKKDASYNERLLVWDSYLKIFWDYPLIGVGSYNSVLYQNLRSSNESIKGLSTHNLYLGVLVEHGLIGLLLFCILVLKSIFITIRYMGVKFTSIWVVFMLAPILIINWAEYNLIPGQVFYWTTLLTILFPRMMIKT